MYITLLTVILKGLSNNSINLIEAEIVHVKHLHSTY